MTRAPSRTSLVGPAASSRLRIVIYWITTVIIAAESAVGGVWDVLRIDYVREVLEQQLGYPPYVAVIIGVCKIPAALVLVAPRFPRLKEWVYAGVVFIYLGAVASHLAVGDAASAIGPLGFTAITLISWSLRPAARRVLVSRPWTPVVPRTGTQSGRTATLTYWIPTGIVVFVLLTGGFADLLNRPETAAGVLQLGYPWYFVSILGTWKLLGAITLLIPRFPRLKEWAYAGAFYNFAGALASHVISGSEVHHMISTGLFAACTLASWAARPPGRALESSRSGGPAAASPLPTDGSFV